MTLNLLIAANYFYIIIIHKYVFFKKKNMYLNEKVKVGFLQWICCFKASNAEGKGKYKVQKM